MIRQVSFDLWLTLIKSNPLYKVKKAEFLKQYVNDNMPTSVFRQFDQTVYEAGIRAIGKQGDFLTENFKMSVQPEMLTCLTLSNFVASTDINHITMDHVREVTEGFAKLQLKYPPELIEPNTAELLSELTYSGVTLNIASNTGFSSGKTMRMVLSLLDIYQYFKYEHFSDEYLVGKPHHAFFRTIFEESGIADPKQILHVGDNPIADIKGASEFGFSTFQFGGEGKQLVDVVNFVRDENRRV